MSDLLAELTEAIRRRDGAQRNYDQFISQYKLDLADKKKLLTEAQALVRELELELTDPGSAKARPLLAAGKLAADRGGQTPDEEETADERQRGPTYQRSAECEVRSKNDLPVPRTAHSAPRTRAKRAQQERADRREIVVSPNGPVRQKPIPQTELQRTEESIRQTAVELRESQPDPAESWKVLPLAPTVGTVLAGILSLHGLHNWGALCAALARGDTFAALVGPDKADRLRGSLAEFRASLSPKQPHDVDWPHGIPLSWCQPAVQPISNGHLATKRPSPGRGPMNQDAALLRACDLADVRPELTAITAMGATDDEIHRVLIQWPSHYQPGTGSGNAWAVCGGSIPRFWYDSDCDGREKPGARVTLRDGDLVKAVRRLLHIRRPKPTPADRRPVRAAAATGAAK